MVKRSKCVIVLIAALLILLNSSCDIKSPVENVDVIFNAKKISTMITGNFTDAKTGELIEGHKINIYIEGSFKNNVVNLTEEQLTVFSTREGFISFALTEDIHPSPANPVSLIVIAKSDGYKSNSVIVDIINTGYISFSVSLAAENNLPDGVISQETQLQTNSSGITTAETNLTATETGSGVTSWIRIPAGVKINDKNGNPLVGNLSMKFTYYSPAADQSLVCFPGGFAVNINKNGLRKRGSFITSGAADITIKDRSGKEARYFGTSAGKYKSVMKDSLPLFGMEIPSGIINPETGQPVKEGDEVDFWSRQNDSTEWFWEKRSTLKFNSTTRKFFMSEEIKHLTLLNLDWFLDNCYNGGTITFTGTPPGYPVRVVVYLPGYIKQSVVTDGFINFIWAPDFPVNIRIYDGCTGELLSTLNNVNPCTVNTTIDLGTDEATINITLSGEAWCPDNPGIRMRPSFSISAFDNTCGRIWYQAGSVTNGSGSIDGLIIGHDYNLKALYNGNTYGTRGVISESGIAYNYSYIDSSSIIVNVGPGGVAITGWGLILDSATCHPSSP